MKAKGRFSVQVMTSRMVQKGTILTREYDPPRNVDVIVEVDLERLARELGPKAFKNAKSVATEAGGAVSVRLADPVKARRQS